MKKAEATDNEEFRLRKLIEYSILDTEPESDFDDIVKIASIICDVPIALVSLIDENRQWFKAKIGLDVRETSRDISFCGHAIHGTEIFEVENALEDNRFFDNPLVTQNPSIRFYAGMPLITSDGYALGTLCVIDSKPRKLTENQKEVLRVLAKSVVNNLDLKAQNKELRSVTKIAIDYSEKAESNEQIAMKALSILSHDMKEPINSLISILDYSEQLDWQNQGMLKGFIQSLKGQAKNSQKLMNDILVWAKNSLLSKLESSQLQEVNLKNEVDEIFFLKSEKAKEIHSILLNEIPDDFMVKIDLFKLQFILRNLVDNSLKYTKNGVIGVRANAMASSFEIEVYDSGIGMSEETINKVFNASNFFTTLGLAGEKGSGLGIQLSLSYLSKMDGEFAVKSKPTEGTTITLRFPKIY